VVLKYFDDFERFVACVKLLLSYKPDLTIKDKGDMTAGECAGFFEEPNLLFVFADKTMKDVMMEERPGNAQFALLKVGVLFRKAGRKS
jgi:hypothetical protein